MKKLGYLLTGVVLGATLFGGAQAAVDGILAQRSSAPFFLNGSPVEVETYLIHNNHFFKLRDIAALVDFGVTWNAESGTVSIDTMTGYDGEYKAPDTTGKQAEPTASAAPTAYHEQANAAVFDSVYTEDAYDALRQCMAEGKSSSFVMSTDTHAAMQSVVGALGSYPSYDFKSGGDGTGYFQSKYPTAYEEAAKVAQKIVNSLAGKSESDKLYAFACYVCERLDYDANSTTTPRVLFTSDSVNKGNCMSFSHNFQYLCDVAEIPCVLVHSDIHEWIEVYTEGRWYNVDLTSFDHHYTEGSRGLLGVETDLQGKIYKQSNPRLTAFVKEALVPGSTQ